MNRESKQHSSISTRHVLLAAGVALSLGSAAQAQVTYNWLAGVSDSWHEPLAWSPAGVPDTTTESAVIGAAGVYTVSLTGNNVTINNLSVTSPTAELLIEGRVLSIYGGSVVNNGMITVDAGAGAGVLRFRDTSVATLSGSGTVLLISGPTPTNARIDTAFAQSSLEIGVGQTITGSGSISLPFHNEGTLYAGAGDYLQLTTGAANPTSSVGTIEANGGGIIQLRNITLDLMSTGTVLADGGEIHFDGSSFIQRLSNGTVSTANGGLLRSISGNADFENMVLNGDATGEIRHGYRLYGSTFTNNGSISLAGDGVNGFNAIGIYETPYTIDGVGEMVFSHPAGMNPGAAPTVSDNVPGGNGVLTNGVNHTIRGKARIAIDTINQGSVIADVPDESLDLIASTSMTNEGTLKATNNGIFKVSGQLTQTGAGKIAVDGGFFDFGSASPIASVTGGTIVSSNGGKARIESGNGFIENVTFDTDTDLLGQTLYSRGGNTNNGSMVLQRDGGNFGIVRFDAPQTWDGTGEIVLNSVTTLQDAQLTRLTAGDEVVHAPTHTIRGTGLILAAINNQGLISADVPGEILRLQTDDKKNTGTIRADSGIIDITAITLDQTGGGLIEAINSGEIAIGGNGGSEIINGTIDVAGGVARVATPSNKLDGIHLLGELLIESGSTELRNTITNDGVIWQNPTSIAGAQILYLDGSVVFDGIGIVRLGGPAVANAVLLAVTGGADLVQNQNHTIEGTGRIAALPVVNHGTLAPGENSNPGSEVGELRIDTATSIDCQSTSVVNLQLAGTNTGEFDRIYHSGNNNAFHCDGTLNVSHTNGFDGPDGQATINLITANTVTGTFSTVNLPAPAHGHYKIVYTATAVQLVLCYADCDASGSLNIFDYICFGNLYAAGDPYADCDGSGSLNVFDYICFGNEYAAGCP
ncbi:MAG: hypothetical protein H6815_00715 [Phycisphaeraceae bacterium]|nr:hypothetical protein [Phycisphaerales bacterium]MCB9858946.1 hypothetical protein [Phycisphaeraceae bacterium]